METIKQRRLNAWPILRIHLLIFAIYTIPIYLYDLLLSSGGSMLFYMILVVLHFLSMFISGVVNLFIDTRKAGNYFYISSVIMAMGILSFGLYVLIILLLGGGEL